MTRRHRRSAFEIAQDEAIAVATKQAGLRFKVGDRVRCDYMLKYGAPQEGIVEELRPKMSGYHVRYGGTLYFSSDVNLEVA
jgi:hypothetical protein